jgi:hypothetical protein
MREQREVTRVRFDAVATTDLCNALAEQLRPVNATVVIGLATGSMFCAEQLAKKLGVDTVIGHPVRKIGGSRDLHPIIGLNWHYFTAAATVIGFDTIIDDGRLLDQLGERVRDFGADYYPAALVGVGGYPRLPRLRVATELPQVPSFFMEDGLG